MGREIYQYDDIYYFNRNDYLLTPREEFVVINSWNEVDMHRCLDDVDIVVIEMIDTEITRYSNGFVDYLLSSLDTYDPGEYSKGKYTFALDFETDNEKFYESAQGFYALEDRHVWSREHSELRIENPLIPEKGLEIQYRVPEDLFAQRESVSVEVFVNGERRYSELFKGAWEGSIFIDCHDCRKYRNDEFDIEIYTNTSFVPAEKGINSDTRELSLDFQYIGSVR